MDAEPPNRDAEQLATYLAHRHQEAERERAAEHAAWARRMRRRALLAATCLLILAILLVVLLVRL